MPASKPLPSLDRVRELLDYTPATGAFTWRVDRGGRIPAGAPAGTITRQGGYSYKLMVIDGRRCYAHALAWMLQTGTWPNRIVGFKDRDGLNLRSDNLVLVTQATNQQRRTRAKTGTRTGLQGVTVLDGRARPYQGRITVEGRVHHLGYHDTPQKAGAAYQRAKRRLHVDPRSPQVVELSL